MIIDGTIEDIVFRNEENGYSVINVSSENKRITMVGKFPPINAGLSIECEGEFGNNSKYGEQFNVKEFKIKQPSTLKAIERYLGSGLIRGVGPVTAQKIVDHFKQDTIEIMEYNPLRIAEIKGISKQKAAEIALAFSELKSMQNAIIFLQEHDFTTNLAIKIFNIYKNDTIEIVKNNPYQLVSDIDGIGFLSADKIAKKMGFDSFGEPRIKAGILHVLKEASDRDGHTYLPMQELIDICAKLLGFDEEEKHLIKKSCDFLSIENIVKISEHRDQEIIMLTIYYFEEKYISQKLTNLSQNIFNSNLNYESKLDFYENLNKIKLNSEQREAILTALTQGVSVITGGPGTGKTTIVKSLIDIIKDDNKTTLLLAPTGRASKRLSEACHQEAKTIHRALEMMPSGEGRHIFHRNESNPLTADVIIIDEMSMVDLSLFYHLLKAVKNTANLVLVGDKDQLPSVGAGNVLKDIIQSDCIKTTHLQFIYRQDEHSIISSNAHLINEGKMPIIDNKSKDFFFINNPNPSECLTEIVNLVSTRLPNFYNTTPKQIQVLAPLKMGVCGVDNLNKQLQITLNTNTRSPQIVDEFTKYKIGDCVMQTTNNYDLSFTKKDEHGVIIEGTGVFNGDMGYITNIEAFTFEMTVLFDDGKICKYSRNELSQISLAYAITIHKSQGSEFEYVVLPIMAGAPIIMTRNLLYTAITRAKKAVVIVGTKQNLARMIHNNYTAKRYTLLSDKIKTDFKNFN